MTCRRRDYRGSMLVVLATGLVTGCAQDDEIIAVMPKDPLKGPTSQAYDDFIDPELIKFRDDVRGQAAPETKLTALSLTTPDGAPAALGDFLAKGNLVVVVTGGWGGSICPYCSTQTSRLIANYDKIKALGAEVVVIYPLAEDADRPRTQDFLARANSILKQNPGQQPPFPFLVDVGLKLVDSLGIRKNLSKPATYILDPAGAVRFAYVGESLADRPSIKALLEQLATLKPPSGEG